MSPIQSWLAIFCGVMAACSSAFQVLCLLGERDLRRQRRPEAGVLVPVSILKPLKGADPQMYESLRSHCLQDFMADYEIVFGVSRADDEAIPFVEKLKQEFPEKAIRLVVCDTVLGANRKVSNLVQMLAQARYDHVLINDSDIHVPTGYLTRVMAWFSASNAAGKVGMVTCMYRAVPGKTIWSKLEVLGVMLDFMPPVLAARFLEGRVYFGLGSTMAVSRAALRDIGGLEKIVDHLADDYELGTRIADAGYKVVLSEVVVETVVPEHGFRDFFDHQLRWGRTVRSSRPSGYFGVVVTFGLLWSALAMMLSQLAWWSACLLILFYLCRLLVVKLVVEGALGDRNVWRLLWLLPLRDLLAPLIWLLSLGGKRILWRGEEFTLEKGKLKKGG